MNTYADPAKHGEGLFLHDILEFFCLHPRVSHWVQMKHMLIHSPLPVVAKLPMTKCQCQVKKEDRLDVPTLRSALV